MYREFVEHFGEPDDGIVFDDSTTVEVLPDHLPARIEVLVWHPTPDLDITIFSTIGMSDKLVIVNSEKSERMSGLLPTNMFGVDSCMHKILLLTGMTPDRRIFDRLLPLLPTAIVVNWIPPIEHESIVSYADRLSRTINHDEPVVVCGVSFGGIIARELACRLNATSCVLISSVRSPRELPPWYRICRGLAPRPAVAILKAAGAIANYWPRRLRSPTTWRLRKLAGNSGEWYRWATAAVLNWKPSQDADRIPSIHIHGDCDATFPIRYTCADSIIHGGGHVLPLTHFAEIAEKLTRLADRHHPSLLGGAMTD